MPDIFGIELKSIVIGNGIDHESIKASIYIDNKKAGELLDDGWCDEIYLEFKNEKIYQRFNEAMKKYYRRNKIKSSSADLFIRKLLKLNGQYKGVKDLKTPGCYQLCFIDEDV